MEINASVIKTERLARSWTQQHLADACNLSLRTVQRVERFGSAAPDTVMELCAVLEISQDMLVISSENGASNHAGVSPVVVVAMMVVMLVFGLVLGAAVTFFVFQ